MNTVISQVCLKGKWIITDKYVKFISRYPQLEVKATCTPEDVDKFNKRYGILLCIMKLSGKFNGQDISILGTYKNCLRFTKKFFYPRVSELIDDILTNGTVFESGKPTQQHKTRKTNKK